MQPAEGGRDGSSQTLGPGYPAPVRIPMGRAYLAKMTLLMAGVVVLGIAAVLYFWPLAWHPVKTSFYEEKLAISIVFAGFASIVVGLYFLVFGVIWAAKGGAGVFLDAEGYTDSTLFTQWGTTRILWSNVRSITANANEQWPPETYVRVDLTNSSVYNSYSTFKNFMASNLTYKKRRRYIFFGPMQPGLKIGLLGNQDVIRARGLSIDANHLASLMNSYLSAWRKEHRHG